MLKPKLTSSILLGTASTALLFVFGGFSRAAFGPPNFLQQSTPPTADGARAQQPAMVRNGQPGGMHRRLDALVGEWDVVMTFYIAGGTPAKPLVANGMTCRREWIAETGNKHLRDVTTGTVGGNRYYRLGVLSYSTMDRRYEWNTVDALNTMMMTYKGAPGSAGAAGDIVMSGEFTDQGVLGDAYAGKRIGQRTVIKFESPDRHAFELYFTPPGERERLVSRAEYARRK
jgi:Protein of unknown function (DUF1579)